MAYDHFDLELIKKEGLPKISLVFACLSREDFPRQDQLVVDDIVEEVQEELIANLVSVCKTGDQGKVLFATAQIEALDYVIDAIQAYSVIPRRTSESNDNGE